jgi:regulatory associated protein of mTOR
MGFSVWDWSRQEKLQSFVNGNPFGTSITSLRWINEDIGGLIMTASCVSADFLTVKFTLTLFVADGIVKLFRNYDSESEDRPLELVTGFRAITDLVESDRGAGIVTAWSQNDGNLLVGGDSHKIILWNAHTELAERVKTHEVWDHSLIIEFRRFLQGLRV